MLTNQIRDKTMKIWVEGTLAIPNKHIHIYKDRLIRTKTQEGTELLPPSSNSISSATWSEGPTLFAGGLPCPWGLPSSVVFFFLGQRDGSMHFKGAFDMLSHGATTLDPTLSSSI